MKIAFVGEAVSGFGGMETVIRTVINSLQSAEGFAVCSMFFFCRNDKMDKEWLNDIPVAYSFSNTKLSFLRRLKHIRAFSKWLSENTPDIVICIDVISCLLANKSRIKSGLEFPIFSWPHFSLDHKKHADCIVYADYHLAISNGIKQQMLARGVPGKNIGVIYNPVLPQEDTIPSPRSDEKATFLYVGRMKFEGQKRVKDLLDGLSRIKGDWHLHAIGDGSDFEKCKSYGRQLGIDSRITWYGWQGNPWDIVRHDIQRVSALLLTSSFEGFGMVLLEAMALGIPCISSNCIAGPEDIIQQGVNGYLYPPGDLIEFIRAMQRFVDQRNFFDPQKIKQSISQFYIDIYDKNMRATILSMMKQSNS
ncbi:lipopolysaccharide 1,6-galactosyltransferase [Salmonella enterica]